MPPRGHFQVKLVGSEPETLVLAEASGESVGLAELEGLGLIPGVHLGRRDWDAHMMTLRAAGWRLVTGADDGDIECRCWLFKHV